VGSAGRHPPEPPKPEPRKSVLSDRPKALRRAFRKLVPGDEPVASGYDPDFKETVVLEEGDVRRDARREMPPILVPCQVEVGAFEALQQLAAGSSPNSQVALVFHFRDLERMGLVDPASGDALLRGERPPRGDP
jgi:hypothetical protein